MVLQRNDYGVIDRGLKGGSYEGIARVLQGCYRYTHIHTQELQVHTPIQKQEVQTSFP
jgi:hypothetical protein